MLAGLWLVLAWFRNLCNWGISFVSLQEWKNLYGIVSYQNFSLFLLHFALLQHVGHKCMGHMYVTMTSRLISGSTSMTHFQLWIWNSLLHENLWGYQDSFIYKQVDILISKNQVLQVLYLKHHVYNETT